MPNTTDAILSQQLFDARIKANEILMEHFKQIVTVASATLVLTVTFLKDIVSQASDELVWTWLLPWAWLLLSVAIVVAVFGIALIINNLDRPDESLGRGGVSRAFAAGAKSWSQWFVLAGIWSFVSGMLLLGLLGILNFPAFLKPDGSAIAAEEAGVEIAKTLIPANREFASVLANETILPAKRDASCLTMRRIVLATKTREKAQHGQTETGLVSAYVIAVTGENLP